jgi:hypothetical protein
MIDTSLCLIVTVAIALAMSILISRRSGQRLAPMIPKMLAVLIIGVTLSLGACAFLGYIAYFGLSYDGYGGPTPEQSTAGSSYVAAWAILIGLICGAVGFGLIYWFKSRSKAQSPQSMEGTTGHCPRCGTTVSLTDQNCPSCHINLAFAREHLDRL